MQTDAATLAHEHPSVIAKFLDDLARDMDVPLEKITDCLSFHARVVLTEIAGQ